MKTAEANTAHLIPDVIWQKFAIPLKLPDAAREEVGAAIETYRAFVDNKSPTGAQQRKHLVEISKQAAAIAASIAALSFSEKLRLSIARRLAGGFGRGVRQQQ
jgi:hypothetical protein